MLLHPEIVCQQPKRPAGIPVRNRIQIMLWSSVRDEKARRYP